MTPSATDQHETRQLVGLVIARAGRIAMTLGGPARWHVAAGTTFLPLEFAGGLLAPGQRLGDAASAIGAEAFGADVSLVSSAAVYGSSPRHLIDRLPPLPDDEPRPLLRLSRRMLDERATPELALVEAVVRSYLARLSGPLTPGTGTAGTLELPLATLRSLIRGLPLTEALALEGAVWLPSGAPLDVAPETAVVYVPSEYGERLLPRIAAKYGTGAIFQQGAENGSGV